MRARLRSSRRRGQAVGSASMAVQKAAMRVNEAVELAREWVRECGSQLPGFKGAHLSGSMNQLPRDAVLPDSADIDVYYLVDDVTPFRQDKFLFRGAFLETVPMSVEDYTS